MVIVAQLVRAPDCGSGGRGFETPHSPHKAHFLLKMCFFYAKKKHPKRCLYFLNINF